ncbi:zinc dependent phospholipase C family protein [Anaerotalea alkaliphila]|uniref:Zinc dependent phospholipase C family protein n=1 Tax=Anaerotalea alkaliphila TaxID=2662126 RepID=A0A7X5HUT2_9FIRM|nr:zinc dependent phospholipase C family protein [Anaerotalea alkaliphila]NDL66970.1 zinc dependent phospholipase C family protein [Anaerotalea alkaliphila]
MNFFTHLLIAKTLYRQLSLEHSLHRRAFSFGNVKPDLSSRCLRNPHTLENHLLLVRTEFRRLLGDMPPEELARGLGEVCHYISDFFCRSHLDRESYEDWGRHFFYELRLHWKMLGMAGKRLAGPFADPPLEDKGAGGDLEAVVLSLRKGYLASPPSMETDLEYALAAGLWACRRILEYGNLLQFADDPDQVVW